MAAYRLFDIFNAFMKTTQVVGAMSWGVKYDFKTMQSSSDGGAGVAARDKSRFFASGRLEFEDVASFGTLLGLWESTDDSIDIYAQGKLAKDAQKAASVTLKRCKPSSASLSFREGQHARCTLDVRNSAAAASTAVKDEVIIAEIAEKSITHAAGYRGVLIKSAVFTPSVGDAITPLGVQGLDLNIRWQVDETAGDDEWGMTVEAARPELTGSLAVQDLTLDTGETVIGQLLNAVHGSLAITYRQQGGQADKVLTLANLQFEGDDLNLRAGIHHSNRVGFGQFFQNGATWYTIGTGSNKLISVA